MKLLYPNDGIIKYPLPGIPNRLGQDTGYKFIAMVADGTDAYVCFSNENMDQIWIEKFSNIQAIGQFHFGMLRRIEDENEFSAVFTFLIEKEILDERPST